MDPIPHRSSKRTCKRHRLQPSRALAEFKTVRLNFPSGEPLDPAHVTPQLSSSSGRLIDVLSVFASASV